jgi:L-threonylcarbamoyladenylate synthase
MAQLISFEEKNIHFAKELLTKGGIIAFPTETVYGIGCSYNNEDAIKKIYQLKDRDYNKPLQILIADLSQLAPLIKDPQEQIEKCDLIKYWPGPLTLIFWKKEGQKEKIGVRMPKHTLLYKLLKETGPLAATSANPSGQPEALTAQQVAETLPEVDLILDGGKAKIGRPSTVVDVTVSPYKVLREGSLKL